MRVFVGTIGYHFLRDYSIGPKLLPQLKAMRWADGVVVDECNWGPIVVVQHFEVLPHKFDRYVFLTASDAGKPAGTITLKRWRGGAAALEEVQGRINEAVTGVISADNLLVIGEYFKIWNDEVFVVDVQPGEQEVGDDLTSEVQAVVPHVLAAVNHLAACDSDDLPPMLDIRTTDLAVNMKRAFSAYVG